MGPVRPKKHLGQHFLTDRAIATRIVGLLSGHGDYRHVLEVGPGTGVLTEHLRERPETLYLAEVDAESVVYLQDRFPDLRERLRAGDFLTADLRTWPGAAPLAVIGNFPYNISSQIFFRVLHFRDMIPEVVGMVQREVAERLASPPGNKRYGILSVLLQAFYDLEYCFTVRPGAFRPPPRVDSAVVRLRRNARAHLACDEALFFRVVKVAFNQRRKTLRNALRPLLPPEPPTALNAYWGQRAERLSVADFERIAQVLGELSP